MKIQFFCLACSYKYSGSRCVAGIDLTNGKLIRLVSRDNSEEVKGAIKKEFCRIDGQNLKPLDIVEVEIQEQAPAEGPQTENYYVDMPFITKYIRKGTPSEIQTKYWQKGDYYYYPFESKPEFLIGKGYYKQTTSISIIKAYSIESYQPNPDDLEQWKVKFKVYSRTNACIELENYSCTESNPDYYKSHFRVGKALLIISLPPDALDSGRAYKFIAGIIPL